MRLPIWRLRTAAVLLAGAFVLHQLRFALLPEAHGDAGHGYLPAAAAVVAGILVLAGLQFAFSLMAAWRGRATDDGPASLGRLWARATLFLLAIHGTQEVVETLASGRPLDSLFSGWWLAMLLAAALGLATALLLRTGAVAVALVVAARARRRRPRSPGNIRSSRPARTAMLRLEAPLARHGAGRAPPLSLT
jgi:hypothetical protein